jgi:hypothetical protein
VGSLKSFKYRQMMIAAVAHFDEGLNLEILLTLKVEKSYLLRMDTETNNIHDRTATESVLKNVNKI